MNRGRTTVTTETESRYRVLQAELGSDRVLEIGVVTVSDDHKLRLASASPERREFLEKMVTRMNGDDVIHVDAAPPPGAARFTVFTRPIRRSDAEFRKALTDHLKKRYRIELRPA
jgi:hypothetical protein